MTVHGLSEIIIRNATRSINLKTAVGVRSQNAEVRMSVGYFGHMLAANVHPQGEVGQATQLPLKRLLSTFWLLSPNF